MKNPRSLAYINMFAVLKDLENLVRIDEKAAGLAGLDPPVTLGIAVAGGPEAHIAFGRGTVALCEGCEGNIRLAIPDCEKFNGMIEGTWQPGAMNIRAGLLRAPGFLKGPFTGITDILSSYLKASPEALADKAFRDKSTTMMFYLIAMALSAAGNFDDIGRVSSAKMPDGSVALEIEGGPAAEIVVRDHRLTTFCRKAEKPRACMIFSDMDTARGLFEGQIDSYSAIATGGVRMKGFIPLVDNVNRLLSRVAYFLG